MEDIVKSILDKSGDPSSTIEKNCDRNFEYMSKIINYGLKNLPSLREQREVIKRYGNVLFNRGVSHGMRRATNYYPGAENGVLRSDWSTTTKSSISVINEDFKTICARAELAYRTDAVARRVVNILKDFVVGQGNQPFPAVKMANGEMVEGVNFQLEQDWMRFNDQGIRNGNMQLTVYQAQALKFVTMVVYGSVIQNVIRARRGSMLPWAFQLLKPTRLDFSKDTYFMSTTEDGEATNKIVHGMRLNAYGEAEEYFFNNEKFARKAENIDLIFFPIETEQYLGISWLTPVLPAIYDRQQLIFDKLKTSRIGAKLGFQFPRNLQEGIESLTETADSGDSYLDLDYTGIVYADGKIHPIGITDPISNTFSALIKLTLQEIAIGMGLSYQRLTTDLDGANFSSARINSISEKKIFNILFRQFIKTDAQLTWNRFVEWEAFTGRLERYGIEYYQYLADPWYYSQCYWLPKDSEDWVDPLKDAQALILLYKTGQITYQELCAKAGTNWRAKIKQIRNEREEIKAAGLEHMLPENISATAKVTDTSNDDSDNEDNNEANANQPNRQSRKGF